MYINKTSSKPTVNGTGYNKRSVTMKECLFVIFIISIFCIFYITLKSYFKRSKATKMAEMTPYETYLQLCRKKSVPNQPNREENYCLDFIANHLEKGESLENNILLSRKGTPNES